MAFQHIRIKNSNTPGKVPGADQIDVAELCVNLQDHKLYSKDTEGNIFELGASGDIPSGGTDDRPGAPGVGELYFDTTLNQLLYWDGTAWVPITGEPDAQGYVKVSGDNMTGDLTLGTNKIELRASDGNAKFASGNYEVGTWGATLNNGAFYINANEDDSEARAIVIQDSSDNSQLISLNKDGSAYFIGKIHIYNSTERSELWIQNGSVANEASGARLNFGKVQGNGYIGYSDEANKYMNIYVNGEELMRLQNLNGVGKRVSIGGSDASTSDELLSVEGTSRFEGNATFEQQVVTGPLRSFDENETARIKSKRTSGDVLTVWGGASSVSGGTKVISLPMVMVKLSLEGI